jgi:hypothetical protein
MSGLRGSADECHALGGGDSLLRTVSGTLVAMGRFETLIDALRSEKEAAASLPLSDPAELTRKISCPQCKRPMETHFYGGGRNVVIDDCESCSLDWLDHGELRRIAAAVGNAEPHLQ